MVFGKGGRSDDPLVLMQEGRYKEAVKLLRLKLKRSPSDLVLKIRLAEALEGAGRRDEAAGIYRQEAEASLSGGERSQCVALLKKAARLLPGDEALALKLAQLEKAPEPSAGESFSFELDGPSLPRGRGGAAAQETGELPAEDTVGWDLAPPPSEAGEKPPAGGDARAPGPEIEALPEEGLEAEAAELAGVLKDREESTRALTPPAVEGAGVPAAGMPQEEPPLPDDFRPLLQAFFPELQPEQVELLHSLARPRQLGQGEVLVREEEKGDSLFIVTRGRLEARGRFEAGEMNLGVLTAGDILGEVAFLKGVPRTATVSAAEQSLVLELPGEATRAQLEGHPAILEHLEAVLRERVERTLAVLKAHAKRSHGHTQD